MTSNAGRIVLIVTVAALILACFVAAITYWFVGPSTSCRNPDDGPIEAGWSQRTLVSGGQERCYHLFVPSGYDASQAMPLIISLHGFLSSPNANRMITRWDRLAEMEGFVVAFPQGTLWPQRWNAGRGWEDPPTDDILFLNDLLDELESMINLETSRIYINGFSNGGGMSVYAGCAMADRVAALGSVAGAVVKIEHCLPSRPVPMMAFHGTADPVVDYYGLEPPPKVLTALAGRVHVPGQFVPFETWTAVWAATNGCNPSPEAVPWHGDVSGVRHKGCDQAAGVVAFSIDGGGHTWPGGMPIPTGKTSRDISATEELWKFFQQYQLDDVP
jgi:polyhydroxybutyrate depolymerase